MAMIPESQYPTQTTPASPTYPLGSAKDVSAPGSGDGTPLQEAWLNDVWGFLQAALNAGKITASGLADTALISQYQQAINNIAAASNSARRITIANSLGTPATNYVCNPGIVWDITNQQPIVLGATLEKDISSPWIPGDNNGAYPSTGAPLTTDTYYHVFALRKDDGTVDSGIDVSASAVNLSPDAIAAGYTTLERVGSLYYNTGNALEPFLQKGNIFMRKTITASILPLTTSYVSYKIQVPSGVPVLAQVVAYIFDAAAATFINVKNTDQVSGADICWGAIGIDGASTIDIITNETQEIDVKRGGGTATSFNMSVFSYKEFF